MRAVDKHIVKRTVFCAMMAALCTALMVITRLISISDYAICALCSIIIGVTVIESGKKWALLTFIVVSLLGLLFGSLDCAIVFAVFFGYYPIIKPTLDRLNKAASITLKMLTFNLCVIGVYYLLGALKIIPIDQIPLIGRFTYYIVLIVLSNAAFLVFDYAFNGVMGLYYNRLHSRISLILKK